MRWLTMLQLALAATVQALSSGFLHAQAADLGSPRPGGLAADTSLFAAVVRELPSRPAVPLRVDPRPLQADPSIWLPRTENLASVPAEVVERRARVLRELGVEQTDAIADTKCGSEPPRSDRLPAGCPQDGQFLSVMIGLPRADSAHIPEGLFPAVRDPRREGLQEGHFAVRVIRRTMTREGAPTGVLDYIFRKDPATGRWTFVEAVHLMVVD